MFTSGGGSARNASISVLSSALNHSSASISRIHSPRAWSRATFRCAPNPRHACSITRALAARAICTVRSLEPESTTITSSQKSTLARQRGSRNSSFNVITQAEIDVRSISLSP
jgi:hypothetical protein